MVMILLGTFLKSTTNPHYNKLILNKMIKSMSIKCVTHLINLLSIIILKLRILILRNSELVSWLIVSLNKTNGLLAKLYKSN